MSKRKFGALDEVRESSGNVERVCPGCHERFLAMKCIRNLCGDCCRQKRAHDNKGPCELHAQKRRKKKSKDKGERKRETKMQGLIQVKEQKRKLKAEQERLHNEETKLDQEKKRWAQERKNIIKLFVEEGLDDDKSNQSQKKLEKPAAKKSTSEVKQGGVFFTPEGTPTKKARVVVKLEEEQEKPKKKPQTRSSKEKQKKKSAPVDGLEDSVKDLVVEQAKKIRKLKKKLRHLRKELAEKDEELKQEQQANKESSSNINNNTHSCNGGSKAPLCIICEENVSDMALLPCGHIFCSNSTSCGASLSRVCPLCRAGVATTQKVFYGSYIADSAIHLQSAATTTTSSTTTSATTPIFRSSSSSSSSSTFPSLRPTRTVFPDDPHPPRIVTDPHLGNTHIFF